jgi:transposase
MEGKPVKTSRHKYDADFTKEVIKMIESGRSVLDVAQSLGIGTNGLSCLICEEFFSF